MTRFFDKLRRFSLHHTPVAARFLFLKLADLCKSFAAKAVSLFSMDPYSNGVDFWDLDHSNFRSQRPRLLDLDLDPNFDDMVYLVPYQYGQLILV
ncbi:hypothetical protein TIFTF001_008779 [Ficus carica]|uniref:Uncharacterized protein n=1 Tax=Ficus carica TaxID=3494 RepID=A0AA88A5K6_FICCA|nr:hypothetical protein TIFTF001_008779 [Ficus carica]